ncbi:caM kinase-like vesicle-associated protein [Platysternon megacephalum]|uniref:CaM kinase-like vesicle-associated protein n=1 Tax=Platysternon megacephalum TaxID=55544 RepID=A0A4D9DR80_9SAUR|nr:caM kinase-like vesicle-associated protein [Platysternon megacephalum]
MGKDRLPSGPSIFLLLLFLLPGNTSPTTEPQYMVLVPFLIHPNVPEKVCIQLTHLNESVTLSATLEYARENRSLIADVVSEKDVFKCVPFTVPKSSSSSAAFLTVLVKGPTLEFRSRKSVLVKNSESLVFVQTDKPIYKPGQTVLFRIVSLDEDFRPLNEKFPLVFIKGLSYQLCSVYVLPKYEVSVKLPKKITIQNEELKVAVCGLYTYGTPVPGLVNVRVCRRFSQSRSHCYGREAEAVCEEFTRQADVRGCVSNVVKTKIFQLKRKGYEMKIEVQGKITEEGTGVELTGTDSSEITGTMSKISFEQVDSHYIPGIPFSGQVKLVDGTNAPIANETIRISIGRNNYEANYTTNEEGRVSFSIDTVNFTDTSIQITANHKSELNCSDTDWVTPVYGNAAHTATRFYSLSKSFLKIEPMSQTLSCGSNVMVRVHYILKPEAVGEQKEIVFYYVVMAKGGIVRAGTEVHPVGDGELIQVFELRLPVGPDIAPLARVLVYTTLPSGEVIANSEDFKIENCFANKVDLHFSPAEGLPASDTHLQVGASPGSLCAIRAVDKSVLLMKPEAELSPSSVYDLLPVKEIRGYNYREHHLEEEDDNPCVKLDNVILNGFIYGPISPDGEGDAYNVLKAMGLKVFTSTKVHKPRLCMERMYGVPGPYVPRVAGIGAGVMHLSPFGHFINHVAHIIDHGQVETIRKYFPETWIWDLVPVKSVGSAELAVTIPDTITEWKANAFCTSSDTGFGLSPTVSLRAFQPFFVELTLPYSVVRSEAFTLRATVFNYLTRCIRVSISLAPSDDFRATPVEKEEESYCLCVNGRKTVSWAVTPKSLGNVNFSVSTEALKTDLPCGNEPEGLEKETTYNFLLCAAGKTAPQPMSLKLPENVVQGSARAYFSVLGYQTQLKYKHWDGSYSTFGPRYGQPGNTWLTAFVLKSFAQARSHIFIEEKHIQDALAWIAGKQKENGCFRSSGTLLNNAIKGGVDGEVTLSAYITIALLEIPLHITHSVVRNALFCLETAAEQRGNHVYTRALLAYAFALAGKEEKRRALLDLLDKEAVKEDGSSHWQRPEKEPKADLPFFHPRAPSAEVEMTSYVLLAYLTTQPAPSEGDLSLAAQIAKWISKQQNPNGGFSSTQDTVVALQALSRYGASTYAKSGGASTVTLQSTGNFQAQFQVDHTNRLLLQRMALPEVPGDYSTGVTGEGCVYVQTSLRYNVLPKPGEAPFALEVHTVPETCDSARAHRTFDIAINISY